jgi:signal transduction histidine kinase
VRLRTRIVVTTLLVAVPMLIVMAWVKTLFVEQAAATALSQGIVELMKRGGRAVCERTPATWQVQPMLPILLPSGEVRGDRPIMFPLPGSVADGLRVGPVGTFAYDANFVASNPGAPVIDPELRERIGREDVATRRVAGRPRLIEVLVRMPWRDGPCAMVLLRRPELRPDESWLELLPIRIWAPVLLLAVVAVVVGLGPAVRRIRQLTDEVRVTASASYQPSISVRGADEIGDLARAFSDAAREIRSRMEAQVRREHTLREFLDNTTHDVMTPLTVLQGHLAAMAACAAPEAPEQLALINAAMDEAHYMASLIHNLSLAAKLEAGEPDLGRETIDLNALIERIVARHQPIARNHDVALEHATPDVRVLVSGDVTFVEQAVSNLALNAIQHVEPGGHVALTLDRVEPDRFAIRIVDDGPGMPASELDRVLERGRRGNQARARAPNGRGLGLDIVHRVVRVHGWELTLATSEPHGLSVTITGHARA